MEDSIQDNDEDQDFIILNYSHDWSQELMDQIDITDEHQDRVVRADLKQWLSPYMIFAQEMRHLIAKQQPNMNVLEMIKTI